MWNLLNSVPYRYKFLHLTWAQVPHHVQNFVVIIALEYEWKQKEFPIMSEYMQIGFYVSSKPFCT